MGYLAYLIYPVMLVLLLVGSKFCKKGEFNEDFLSFEQTKYVQGYLAICIMLHHIGQEMSASWQKYPLIKGLEFFVPLGYLFVGFFLLCSGYGLYVSFQKKPDYLESGFFRRRVLPLLIGYIFSGWLFLACRLIMGQKLSGLTILRYFFGIWLCNPYGWFAIIMPLFYVFFFIAFKFCKKCPILVTAILVTIYTFIGTCIDHNDHFMCGQWWYNCVQMFWIGLLVAKYKDKLVIWARKHYVLKLIVIIALYFVAKQLSLLAETFISYYGEYAGLPKALTVLCRWICLTADMLRTSFFGFMLLMIGLKVRIGNRFLKMMGTITFEFYIIHGLVIEFFSYRFCDVVKPIVRITSIPLMIIVVFVLSLPLAFGMKKICHIFDKKPS